MLLLFLALHMSFAQEALLEIPYGGEITLSRDELINSNEQSGYQPLLQAQREFVRRLRQQYPNCQIQKGVDENIISDVTPTDFHEITTPAQWVFRCSVDFHVLEFQTGKLTLRRARSVRNEMQKLIFDVGANHHRASRRFSPNPRVGMGHIHIGVFEVGVRYPIFFRNLLVYLLNQIHIFKVSVDDLANARTPHEKGLAVVDRLSRGIVALDEKLKSYYGREITNISEQQRVRAIFNEFAQIYDEEIMRGDNIFLGKDNALDINEQLGTFELRSIRAQESADQFVMWLELLQRHIDKVFLSKELIPLNVRDPREFSDTEKVALFQNFVETVGFESHQYRWVVQQHMQPMWRSAQRLKVCLQFFDK